MTAYQKSKNEFSGLEALLVDAIQNLTVSRCSQCKSLRGVKKIFQPEDDQVAMYGGWGMVPPSLWITFNDCCGKTTSAIVVYKTTICKSHIKLLLGKKP